MGACKAAEETREVNHSVVASLRTRGTAYRSVCCNERTLEILDMESVAWHCQNNKNYSLLETADPVAAANAEILTAHPHVNAPYREQASLPRPLGYPVDPAIDARTQDHQDTLQNFSLVHLQAP
jgi:hypothetical protein